MHDLRKQALLESGKTISKKAKSRQASAASSKRATPAASKNVSQIASRSGSDDEADDFSDTMSDTTEFSILSLDELIVPGEETEDHGTARTSLDACVTLILDRKRSSVQGREDTINQFCNHLRAKYCRNYLQSQSADLLAALLKCAKSGASERESILALKAISLIILTAASDDAYDLVANSVKSIVTDSESSELTIAAIHCLAISAFFGGVSGDETEELLLLLQEIVESDGATAQVPDDAGVVAAALEAWGLLATLLQDMEDSSEEVMEVFVDQLDSAHANVQVAAGQNIALLYEMSCTELEEDEDFDSADVDIDPDTHTADSPNMVRRYTVYDREHLLLQKLSALSSISTKRISKRDKRTMHSSFADIEKTVEHPSHGTKVLRVGIGANVMNIRTWEHLHRFNALKRVLQGGFVVHYTENEAVFETLPLILTARPRKAAQERYHNVRLEYVSSMLADNEAD